jgi:hypothetical protein
MTEKEKMLAGMVYSAVDGQLLEELNAVKETIHRYNSLSPADNSGRLEILKGLLGHIADEEIIITGRYPSNEEILEQLDADMLNLLANPAASFAGSGCNGVCSSCHSSCGVPTPGQQA